MTRTLSLAALFALVACDAAPPPPAPAARATEASAQHAVEIEIPSVLRGLAVGDPDVHGRPTAVPCATCHEPDSDRPLPTGVEGIRGPHVGLRVQHGDVPCASCHHPTDRSALRLADGSAIPMTEAMRLCSQCHGTQARDYAHGAHGGMRGHWDLSRGGRERNHCVSCHDPHGPRFGSFHPAPPPRDRFLPTERSHGDE